MTPADSLQRASDAGSGNPELTVGRHTPDVAAGGQTIAEPADSKAIAILDAAEAVFAASGFDGASIREIATRAGVAQALIHYHFQTKDKLFEAVISRRAVAINSSRAEMLDAIIAGQRTASLEALVEALFRPTIEAGQTPADGSDGFARILASFANSHDPGAQLLVERYYDPIARKFIDALCRCEEPLTRADAVWAYMFSIGVGMTMMARTGRSKRLSDGLCNDEDTETMLGEIIVYACGGIRAMAARREQPAS